MKNNVLIAALWRDAEDKDSRGEIFQFYLASDFIGHKSYAYGELSTDELNRICPIIRDCLMVRLPQWSHRILGKGYHLIISSGVVELFDTLTENRPFSLSNIIDILHGIACDNATQERLTMAKRSSVERFVETNNKMYPTALSEIRAGRKWSHWIWYIFPQMRGLGHSPNSEFYGIESLIEADAFLEHPILGAHLREITQAMLTHKGKDAQAILGPIDSMKLRSSMTLFDILCPNDIFAEVLNVFYDGNRCKHTLRKFGNEDKITQTKD